MWRGADQSCYFESHVDVRYVKFVQNYVPHFTCVPEIALRSHDEIPKDESKRRHVSLFSDVVDIKALVSFPVSFSYASLLSLE